MKKIKIFLSVHVFDEEQGTSFEKVEDSSFFNYLILTCFKDRYTPANYITHPGYYLKQSKANVTSIKMHSDKGSGLICVTNKTKLKGLSVLRYDKHDTLIPDLIFYRTYFSLATTFIVELLNKSYLGNVIKLTCTPKILSFTTLEEYKGMKMPFRKNVDLNNCI